MDYFRLPDSYYPRSSSSNHEHDLCDGQELDDDAFLNQFYDHELMSSESSHPYAMLDCSGYPVQPSRTFAQKIELEYGITPEDRITRLPAKYNYSEINLGSIKAGVNPSQSRSSLDSVSPFDQSEKREISRYVAGRPRLRPVSDLPDMFRDIFKFGVFNAVQSTCFDEIMFGRNNLVISAPTGSGKTVLFELGIIHAAKANTAGRAFKCVYVAPTKALCSERFRDWNSKFGPIGLKCCEMTGDTVVFGSSIWGEAKTASIIITTVRNCEKWDSLTRNWRDHAAVLSQVQLFLVDEVHILNESRGSTLEVVTSRMRMRGSAVRFILVSATVPNIVDVANWIGDNEGVGPARVFEFGEEFRPCQLIRHVVGVPRRNGQNDFQFAKTLDYKLFSVLLRYSIGKPILVFCSTRKGVFATAEHLLKDYKDAEDKKAPLPWARPPSSNHSFQDKRLDDFSSFGVGVHHAGLSPDDRRATEDLFLKKYVRILVATSTLAVGVNLPAYMVIIKGVQTFQGNASKEYSDLDIVQMLGRAGRPQFDNQGVAVILCESQLEQKYRTLVQGNTVLESSLHINLAEHLNSEIGLGTIRDIQSSKAWIKRSFLYQRIQQNPTYYSLIGNPAGSWQGKIDDVISETVARLEEANLVQLIKGGEENGNLIATCYGEIMSKFYIRKTTVRPSLELVKLPTQLIIDGPHTRIVGTDNDAADEIVAKAEEFQDAKLRASEKQLFNALSKDTAIRFQVKKVEKTCDKVFVLLQAILGGIPLNSPEYKGADSQLHLEAFGLFKHVTRISRAIIEVCIIKKLGAQVKSGLELLRCFTAKAWEGRAISLRQIDQIGEKSIKVLAEHNITSLAALGKQSSLRIETLLNRRPPFGLEVLSSIAEFPQYSLSLNERGVQHSGGKGPVEIEIEIACELVDASFRPVKCKRRVQRSQISMTTILTLDSEMKLLDFRRIPTKALRNRKVFSIVAELTKPSQSVTSIIASESIAGAVSQQIYTPSVPSEYYPVINTRPMSSVEQDLVGLENDPEFWNTHTNFDSNPIQVSFEKPACSQLHQGRPMINDQEPNHVNTSEKPRMLKNGNYECDHACKDKTVCRHLCCHVGLTEPPVIGKRNGKPTTGVLTGRLTKPSNPKIRGETESISEGGNKELEATKLIHEGADIVKNLCLPEGRRPKIDMTNDRNRKRKRLIPDYDFCFTELKEPLAPPSPGSGSETDELPLSITALSGTSVHGYVEISPPIASMKIQRKKVKLHGLDRQLFLPEDGEDVIEVSSPTAFRDRTPDVQISQHGPLGMEALRLPETGNHHRPIEQVKVNMDVDFNELDEWLSAGTFKSF